MSDKEEWEDEEFPDDYPFDEDGEFLLDDLLEEWDDIDDIDDYQYVEGERN